MQYVRYSFELSHSLSCLLDHSLCKSHEYSCAVNLVFKTFPNLRAYSVSQDTMVFLSFVWTLMLDKCYLLLIRCPEVHKVQQGAYTFVSLGIKELTYLLHLIN